MPIAVRRMTVATKILKFSAREVAKGVELIGRSRRLDDPIAWYTISTTVVRAGDAGQERRRVGS
jgi:hypothetical protein